MFSARVDKVMDVHPGEQALVRGAYCTLSKPKPDLSLGGCEGTSKAGLSEQLVLPRMTCFCWRDDVRGCNVCDTHRVALHGVKYSVLGEED